ncbi:MAG: ATP-binding protein [Rhodopila sp.]
MPPLFADRGQLETVLVNLATNARDAMPSGGMLTFSARSETVAAGESHPAGLTAGAYVRISVADTGSGMNTAVLARVTEPFFTTKEPGKGTGLGLAMAKGFVEQSEGRLSIESVEGKGTVVHLWLPQADGISSKTSPAATAPSPVPITPTVPLVDDDPIVRTVLTASLEDVGFSVTAVDSGSGALALLRKRGSTSW